MAKWDLLLQAIRWRKSPEKLCPHHDPGCHRRAWEESVSACEGLPSEKKRIVNFLRKWRVQSSLCSLLSLSSRPYMLLRDYIYSHFIIPLRLESSLGEESCLIHLHGLQCLQPHLVPATCLLRGRTPHLVIQVSVWGGTKETCALAPDIFLAMLCWSNGAPY